MAKLSGNAPSLAIIGRDQSSMFCTDSWVYVMFVHVSHADCAVATMLPSSSCTENEALTLICCGLMSVKYFPMSTVS